MKGKIKKGFLIFIGVMFFLSLLGSENYGIIIVLLILGMLLMLRKNKILKKELEKRILPEEKFLEALKSKINELTIKKENMTKFIKNNKNLEFKITEQLEEIANNLVEIEKLDKKLIKLKAIYDVLKFSKTKVPEYTLLVEKNLEELIDIEPRIELKLQNQNVKTLRKLFNENKTKIRKLIEQHEVYYRKKASKSIYRLMVIALQSELQNILYDLKYNELYDSINKVKDIVEKYLSIAEQGNQEIKTTIIKFVSELEYLFIEAVKIEYNYYVKKERARQEQLEIRQRMKEEAEERKRLNQEKEKIEKEELKYKQELERASNILENSSNNEEIERLNRRILELTSLLSDVAVKKEEVLNLQNGKAGNVYIISNLGSFGENVFKIGMTRRLNPQERINELGSASVPFKFDVHSFIFSENAVELENSLHKRLNDKRVNKVNLRKEFFYSTLEELEILVNELDPTAEFNKTMLAEEYNQSISSNFNYEDEELEEIEDLEDENEEVEE